MPKIQLGKQERPSLGSYENDPRDKIANRLFFVRVGLVSLVMAITGFAIYCYFGNPAVSGSIDALRLTQAQTAAFLGLTIVTQLMITYVPFFQTVFRTAAFPNAWWPIIILALFPGFIVVEIEKLLRRQFTKIKLKYEQ